MITKFKINKLTCTNLREKKKKKFKILKFLIKKNGGVTSWRIVFWIGNSLRVDDEPNWGEERELEGRRNGESLHQLQDRSRQAPCSSDLRFIGLLPLRLSKFQSPLPRCGCFHRSPLLSRHSRPSLPPYECLVSILHFFSMLVGYFLDWRIQCPRNISRFQFLWISFKECCWT